MIISSAATPTPPPGPGAWPTPSACARWWPTASGRRPSDVLVCQTGLIGIPLPMAPIVAGHPRPGGGPGRRAPTAAAAAATAIMTTDTDPQGGGGRRGRASPSGAWPRGRPCWPPTWPPCWPCSPPTPPSSRPRCSRPCGGAVDAVVQPADRRRVHVDQRHRDRPGQRPGRDADRRRRRSTAALTEACAGLAGQMAADAEGATKVVQVGRDRGRLRRRGPPGGAQGGRLAIWSSARSTARTPTGAGW